MSKTDYELMLLIDYLYFYEVMICLYINVLRPYNSKHHHLQHSSGVVVMLKLQINELTRFAHQGL